MNCIIIDHNAKSLQTLSKMIESVNFLSLKATFEQSMNAINYVQNEPVDLLFLEIDLPDIKGWDLLDVIPNHPLVIVTTDKADYAVQAFEQHVVDFLLKPVKLKRFLSAVNFAKTIWDSRKVITPQKEILFVKTNGRWEKLNIKDIKYIQALGDYVRIFTTNSNYVVNKSMKAILQALPEVSFARVHRSYIINISKIENIEENSIVIDRDVIPISDHYKPSFLQKLNIL